MASLKVRTDFGYHAAILGLSVRDLARSCVHRVTRENIASRAGVVRRMVGPLALGLDAEMGTHFLECDFDLPSADEPGEDVLRFGVEIGCKECLRVELAGRIANQKPADRDRRKAAMIPDGSAGCDFHEAIGSAVPQTDPTAFPRDFAILEKCGKLFVGLSFDGRPAAALGFWRREFEQVGIQSQARNDADMLADGGEELDCSKCTVGDQDDVTVGKPAMDLQDGLPGPIDYGLVFAWLTFIEPFGGSKQRKKRQRHDATGPRHVHQQHGRKPA